MKDIPIHELLNVTPRLMDWQRANQQIHQQSKHAWVLKGITRDEATLAIEDALKFAEDLRQLADVIERSAKQTAKLVEESYRNWDT